MKKLINVPISGILCIKRIFYEEAVVNYIHLIENKTSVREYLDKKISEKEQAELKSFFDTGNRLDSAIKLEIVLLEKEQVYQKLAGYAGYHGIMLAAPLYALVLSEKKEHFIENVGFIGEQLCLKAFSMGIGSCFITFPDSDGVLSKLSIQTDKEVAALIALGYGKKQKNLLFHTTKVGGNYAKTEFFKQEKGTDIHFSVEDYVYKQRWGEKASLQELSDRGILDAFRCAISAPSTLNRQPWRFLLDGEKVVLVIERDSIASSYEEKMDIGIVMYYFKAAAEESLFSLQWDFCVPKKDYGIPEEFYPVAVCRL